MKWSFFSGFFLPFANIANLMLCNINSLNCDFLWALKSLNQESDLSSSVGKYISHFFIKGTDDNAITCISHVFAINKNVLIIRLYREFFPSALINRNIKSWKMELRGNYNSNQNLSMILWFSINLFFPLIEFYCICLSKHHFIPLHQFLL